VARHRLILVLTSVHSTTNRVGVNIVNGACNQGTDLMNIMTSSPGPPVPSRNSSALRKTLLYSRLYRTSQKCSSELYSCRWTFSMYCPWDLWMETEAAWMRFCFPSWNIMSNFIIACVWRNYFARVRKNIVCGSIVNLRPRWGGWSTTFLLKNFAIGLLVNLPYDGLSAVACSAVDQEGPSFQWKPLKTNHGGDQCQL